MLAANGAKLEKEGSVLRTCGLRCAGIYGEGEQRHLPRIVVSFHIRDFIDNVMYTSNPFYMFIFPILIMIIRFVVIFKDYLEKGLVLFTFGDQDVKTDFLHVDNLVQAHIRAAAALMLPKSTPVSYTMKKTILNVFL